MRRFFSNIGKLKSRVVPATQDALTEVWSFWLQPFARAVFIGGIVLSVVAVLLLPDTVEAQLASWTLKQVGLAAAAVATWLAQAITDVCIAMTVFLLRFFIQLASYNGYLDAPIVRLGWQLVRDIANMAFVIFLLVIAFATILGQESYEWKRTMVKLVIAAIAVNFSLLICGLIIDAAHVVTVTFINAIAPVAGGNLINMFSLQSIRSILPPGEDGLTYITGIDLNIYAAAMVGLAMSIMAMISVGAYAIILLGRMVYLWVLLILSPLAFVASVIPATKGLAQQWIADFTKYVMVAPLMVFFMWLAFATYGQPGSGALELDRGSTQALEADGETAASRGQLVSFNAAATWHGLASFLVGAAFLFAGITQVQKMGVAGGSLLSNATSFAARVATIASGYAAGRFFYEKGAGVAGAVVAAPGKAFDSLVTTPLSKKWQTQKAAAIDTFYRYGSDVTDEGKKAYTELQKINEAKKARLDSAVAKQYMDQRDNANETEQKLREQLAEVQEKINATDNEEERQTYEIDASVLQESIDKIGEEKATAQQVLNYSRMSEGDLEKREKAQQGIFEANSGGRGRGAVARTAGFFARTSIQIDKQLAKTEKKAENQRKLLWKRTGSEAGGHVLPFFPGLSKKLGLAVGSGTHGLFNTGIFADPDEQRKYHIEENLLKENKEKIDRLSKELSTAEKEGNTGDTYKGMRRSLTTLKRERNDLLREKAGLMAQDRVERGLVKAEDYRGDAKDQEFENYGFRMGMVNPRLKYDVNTGKLSYQIDKGSVGDQSLRHQMGGEYHQFAVDRELAEARQRLLKGQGKIGTLPEGMSVFMDGKASAEIIKETLQSMESKMLRGKKSEIFADGYRVLAEIARQELDLRDKKNNAEAAHGLIDQVSADEDEIKRSNRLLGQIEKQLERMEGEAEEGEATPWVTNLFAADGEPAEELTYEDLQKKQQELEENKTEIRKQKKAREGEIQKINAQDPEVQARRKVMEEKRDRLKSNSIGYQYAAQKAEDTEAERAYLYTHNSLISDAEQRLVWDRRGVSTPTSALNELIEKYESDFRQMDYDTYVENLKSMFKNYQKLSATGDLTSSDKAAMMGVMMRGFGESWMDDAIISIMSDEELAQSIGAKLGWKDQEYDPSKIRDVMMLFASGGNVKFATDHSVIGEVGNIMTKNSDLKERFARAIGKDPGDIGQGDILNAFKRNEQGNFRFGEVQSEVMAELNEAFEMKNRTTEQLAEVLQNIDYDAYMGVLEEHQAAMQVLGNLREKAIGKNHSENAGYFQKKKFKDAYGREQDLYLSMGDEDAINYVFADLNKTDARTRARQHSHVAANIDEPTGALTRVRADHYALLRNGINSSYEWTGTNSRWIKQFSGIGAGEDLSAYKGSDGLFSVGSRADGSLGAAAKAFRAKYRNRYAGKSKSEAADLDRKYVLTHIFAPQMAKNPVDFLLTMAQASGLSSREALQGKMKLRVGDAAVTSFNQLAGMVNDALNDEGLGMGYMKREIGLGAGGRIRNYEPRIEELSASQQATL